VGDEGTHHPSVLLFVESTTGDEDVDMDMPGETPAKRVHDHHKAGEIERFGFGRSRPISKRLIHNRIEAIKISFSADTEIVEELMGRGEDHVLILTVGKQRGICFNPRISLSNATRRAESGFTGMEDLFFIATRRALVQVKSHLLGSAFEHFIDITRDTSSLNLFRVKRNKWFPVVEKYLFELFASDQLHIVEAGEVV
jgi:hypothetical protein